MHSGIRTFLTRHRSALVKLTQELVRVESVNGNETEVSKILASVLRAHGIRCRFVGPSARRSLIAEVGNGKSSLMLNAHLDTVAPGNAAGWRYPPFSARVNSGRIYGRGSYDLKGAVAAATFAALAVRKVAPKIRGKIVLVFNADEESGQHTGIKAVLASGVYTDAAICCEPMSNKMLAVGAKGIYRFELISKGTAGHTGYPKGRINSVTKMAKLVLALETLRFQYRKSPIFSAPYVVPGTMVSGGTAINVFPENCHALVDCRLSLGQPLERVRNEIAACLKKVRLNDSQVHYEIRELGFVPAAFTEVRHSFVQLSRKVISDVFGFSPSIGTLDGVTDGNFLMDHGIPTVIYGPTGENIHAPNEFVSIASLLKTAESYALTAVRYFESSKSLR